MIKTKVTKPVDPMKQLLRQLQNSQAALDEIGKHLVASTQRRLKDTKESPDGSKFAPWTLATLLGRTKKGTAARGILFDSGNLYNSIMYQAQGPRAANGRFQRSQVVVGVDEARAPYGKFLQSGTPNMVARPFIGISKTDSDVIASILRRHITGR